MACPYNSDEHTNNDDAESSLNYIEYLHLDELLNCTKLTSEIHDEHLFIIVHQVYELWFKQIIFEIDSVREIFSGTYVDEKSMLIVNTRLARIVKIISILVDQIKILETMTPLDFAAFRSGLKTSSGFQSWQFRLIENKIGVNKEQRIQYNQKKYSDIFQDKYRTDVEKSENEASIFSLISTWLERTPGLKTNDFDFWKLFTDTCNKWFNEEMELAQKESDPIKRNHRIQSCKKSKETYDQILVEENYNALVDRGDRSLSWAAFKGALMIYYNREETHFHEPFQLLSILMDIDVVISQWRSGHILLVQRQIGSKTGTGGSSGYFYLRSTISERYRPFLDFFQLSNYLIPVKYINDLRQKK